MKILKEVIIRYQTEDGRIVKAYEQEEVIRCENCEFRKRVASDESRCEIWKSFVPLNGYCFKAKRRKEE